MQALIRAIGLETGLFPDVLKNMQTEDLEQKKLVYLCGSPLATAGLPSILRD